MKNRIQLGRDATQQNGYSPTPVMVTVTSPHTLPGMERTAQQHYANHEECTRQASEARSTAQKADEDAAKARDHITQLERALQEQRAELAAQTSAHKHALQRAAELDEAAKAALTQAEDLKGIVTFLRHALAGHNGQAPTGLETNGSTTSGGHPLHNAEAAQP